MLIAWALAAMGVLLQMATNGRYGYFRDELYFLATSDHLAFGYVDFAPLSSLILHVSRVLFGESQHAIRFFPALALGGNILITGLITGELGGKRFATFLGCLSALLSPVIIGNATRFSMNPFEPLFWMGSIYFLLRAINLDDPRKLVWCGVLIGLGLENKHSTAFFLISLLAALAVTPARRFYRSKYLWIAAALIVLLALPNLIWQVKHDYPTWVDLNNVKRVHKNVELPPIPFLKQQLLALNPLTALVWLPGLGFLLFHSRAQKYRVLGVTYLFFLAIMMALHGKDYYLAPIYPMLFAAGGVLWETLTAVRPRWRWLRVALPASVAAAGILTLPLAIPILPVDKLAPYLSALGLGKDKTEVHHDGPLPQQFGDEFGWPEMVAAVAQYYDSLPPDLRAKTGILAGNYGEAGAIDFFGPKYGLPKAISAHQNYYYWGPRNYTGESLIVLQWDLEDVQHFCNDYRIGPVLDPPFGMGEEHYTVLHCLGLKKPLPDVWDRLKHWN
jgi:Dolichyl-phosphate-mannose-protein mannosyltransferase